MSNNVNLKNPDTDTLIEFLIIDTINLWRNKLGTLAKKYQLSRLERRILIFIGRYDSIRQSDLAVYMDVEPQSLTRALESMEKKNWLKKVGDVKDKRAKGLVLTEEGELKIKEAIKISEEIRPHILKNIAFDDKTKLINILNLLKENLNHI